MSKQLANATLNLILAEVSKDLVDPSMGDHGKYWQILSTGIEKFIQKMASCEHNNTVTKLSNGGLSGSGKKIISKITHCEDCGRVLSTEVFGKANNLDTL